MTNHHTTWRRRLGALGAVACAIGMLAIVPGAQAQTGEAEGLANNAVDMLDPFCKSSYRSGEQCQAPDRNAGEGGCQINSWVGSATCELAVADGEANHLQVGWSNRAESGEDVSFNIVVRDAETGTVLWEESGEGGVPDGPPGFPVPTLVPLWETNHSSSASVTVGPLATGAVTCEITGTHTAFGAVFPNAHNSFACAID